MTAIGGYARVNQRRWRLICEGDSLMRSGVQIANSSYGSATSFGWRLPSQFDPVPQIRMRAVAGTGMQDMYDRRATVLNDCAEALADGEKPIVLIQMSNGLIGLNPEDFWDLFETYLNEIFLAGGYPVPCHLFHRDTHLFPEPGGPDPPPYNSSPGFTTGVAVNEFNDLQDSHPDAYVAIVPFRTHPIGQQSAVGSGLGSALYPDGCHCSSGCYQLATYVAKSTIEDVLALVL